MVVGACNPAPSQPAEPAHEKHLTPRLIAQRIMYCDDGSRADVDFIDDGLKMAVTWLPKGRTEILHAQRTGDEFRGDQSRAVVAGGSIAFTQRGRSASVTEPRRSHRICRHCSTRLRLCWRSCSARSSRAAPS
jgi:hypothetical protein